MAIKFLLLGLDVTRVCPAPLPKMHPEDKSPPLARTASHRPPFLSTYAQAKAIMARDAMQSPAIARPKALSVQTFPNFTCPHRAKGRVFGIALLQPSHVPRSHHRFIVPRPHDRVHGHRALDHDSLPHLGHHGIHHGHGNRPHLDHL